MGSVGVGGPAEPVLDWYKHQSCAMGDRNGEGPEPELRWPNSHQHPRMAPVDEPEDAESDDQETGANLDRLLPFDEGDQQRKRQGYQGHFQQMADPARPKRRHEGPRAPLHQSG